MSKAHLQALFKDASEQVEGSPLTTSGQDQQPSKYIVAVVQNRAKEVGLAALDPKTCSTLWLAQYVEATRSFTTTQTMLELYPPDVLLVVASKDASVPDTGLNAALMAFEQTALPRNAFDDSEGTVLVQTCALESSSVDAAAARGSYLCLGAAGALLKFMREQRGMLLASSSLNICHALSSHHTHIDAASIEALELVQPLTAAGGRRRGGGGGGGANDTSLLHFLDGTCTKAGSQLLRANLLQPLKDIPTLNARYDALGELRGSEELTGTLIECLGQLPKNLDSVCASLVLRPAKSESGMLRRVSAMIQSFIQLRELLMTLERLGTVLEEVESELLCVLRSCFTDPTFSELFFKVDALLDEDVQSARGAFLNRTQQCFALKSGMIPLLDVARTAFCTATEAVHEHASALREEHDMHDLKVQYTARRGFYFAIPVAQKKKKKRGDGGGDDDEDDDEDEVSLGAEQQQGEDDEYPYHRGNGGMRGRSGKKRKTTAAAGQQLQLPSVFCLLQRNAHTVQCTTDELNALNARLRDAANDCLCLTEEALEGASGDIISDYLPSLHRLIDGIALLDMLCGFARQLDAHGKEYVRPTLTTTGPLALVACRHPVLEAVDKSSGRNFHFQANDTWLSVDASLHVITGPNMAGKSTYLRQVAAAVVMAQVGCHVAAGFASLTPVDRILTRIGTSDSLETNSSSFMVEMQETAYILRHATPQSLVLIDELGRATSTADGLGVAWAVAETLALSGAHTLLATHFSELTELAVLYPQCRAWHFSVDTSRSRLEYSWKLKPGKCQQENKHYGLALAAVVAFPEEALERAKTVVQVLDAHAAAVAAAQELDAEQQQERPVWEIVGKMACLAQAFLGDGDVDEEEMMEQVKVLQREAAAELG